MFLLCILLSLLFSISGTMGDNFKVGLVCDQYLSYAPSDQLILNGVMFWQNWVNNLGGLVYNGTAHQVDVIHLDASSADPNQTNAMVTERYEKLVTIYNVNMLVSPFAAGRSTAAIAVSEKYDLINFVPASLLDSAFASTNTYLFTAAMPSVRLAVSALNLLIAKGVKNYIMVRRPDAISVLLAKNAIAYLNASNVAPLSIVWLNMTTSNTQEITTSLRGLVSNVTSGRQFDVFIYAGMSTEFPIIASVFNELAPDAKAAVLLTPMSRYEQKNDELGYVGDFWITTTRFDPDFSYGVSGELGGTTEEFVQSYEEQFNRPPSTFDAWTPALLMAYYEAVTKIGTIESNAVRAELKAMDRIETFACPVKFLNNGTNQFSTLETMQLFNGEGELVTMDTLIYPAPFNSKTKGLSTTIIIAIVIPVAFIVIFVMAVGTYYMRRQREEVVKALTQAEEGERRNYRIDYSSLTVGSAIGTGGFGIVYKGEYRGADVAIKKLKSQVMNKSQLDEFAKESAVMIGLRHPNILLFMGVCLEPSELCIITEFMPRGSLYDIIHNDNIKLPSPLVKNMILDILKGLHFIHSAGIIHRDLKSPNLLVDRSWNIKIADFGLSATKAHSDDDAQISLLWTAPEILRKDSSCYSEKSDVYSFGIILWEILARKTPFDDHVVAAIAPAVVNGKRPPIDPEWNSTLSSLITLCWAPSPAVRPNVKEARTKAEDMYSDPCFEIGSSSTLMKYMEKAPPPTDVVTFVHTAVSHSAVLWEHDPHTMMRALLQHNEILRTHMGKFGGYEVKYSGDSFTIAFASPVTATSFCLAVQKALLNAAWPEALLHNKDAEEQKTSSGTVLFRGLALCIGLHTTATTTTREANSGKFEYFSPELSYASLYSEIASKGCIAMGADMYTKVMGNTDKVEAFCMESLGKGVVDGKEVSTYQMTPVALKERAALKLTETPGAPYDDKTPQFAQTSEKWRIQFQLIELKDKIGAGSFGEVRWGIYRDKKVAVKQLLRQKLADEALLELHVESTILSSLKHPNILAFIGMCIDLPNLCLVTEYMEKGSLTQVLYQTPVCPLNWDQKLKVARDIAQGMAYLHSKKVIHRDIKPSNMLVANDYTVKIADFGFSRMKADNQTMTQVGTVAYSAPEIFEGLRYTDKADVYSFGILLWEVVFCRKPWDRMHSMKIVTSVTAGERCSMANVPAGAPAQLITTLQECWKQDPASRPSFDEILVKLR